jgi:hypothetical protein
MVRTLLIWLLVLALPAQGAMAATMAFCGPNHHAAAYAAAAKLGAQAEHEHHEHATHAAIHVADGQDSETASVESATPEPFAQSDMQKCSVCASCCSAAAIQSTVAKLPSFEPAATVFATVAAAVEPFAADGPDRPPRHLLA